MSGPLASGRPKSGPRVPSRHRQAISVSGVVQGVGFRPFVHALATRLGLSGFVRNQMGRVHIEVEGELQSLERFARELRAGPPLARIATLSAEHVPPVGDDAFRGEMRTACDEHARRRPVDPALWSAFACNIFYHQGEYEDPASFASLKQRLADIERTLGLPGNRVFYLATPPSSFASVIRSLGQADLAPKPPPPGSVSMTRTGDSSPSFELYSTLFVEAFLRPKL